MKPVKSVQLTRDAELRLTLGDLTMAETDVIVNAANERLRHGAGVAGAIVRRGGEVIQAESNAWVQEYGPISHDRPALTTAGDLQCNAIIHVVGPRWGEGDEDRKLMRTVIGALDKAAEESFNSIAFPAISTGIFGFPMDRAARVMFQAVESFLETNSKSSIRRIEFILFDQPAVDTFLLAMKGLWPEKFPSA